MSIEELRLCFEDYIRNSKFKDSTPLGPMTINGIFSHYMDPDTDTMWIGFSIGMRYQKMRAELRSSLLSVLEQRGQQLTNL